MAPKPALNKGSSSRVLNLHRPRTRSKSASAATLQHPKYLRVEISQLEASNLTEMDMQAFGGLSDPFIRVSADPAQILVNRDIRSEVIYRSINPSWNEVLSFIICTVDLQGLSNNAHLFLSVWDHDMSKAADLIGLMAIPLKEIIEKCQTLSEYAFDGPILSKGHQHGELRGVIKMAPVVEAEDALDSTYPLEKDFLLQGLTEDYNLGTIDQVSGGHMGEGVMCGVPTAQCRPGAGCSIN
jgi:C2 domain